MSQPRISAILPNYNSSEFLAQSLQSLIQQTEPFDEIVVVDDGSTDDSLTIIQSFMKNHPSLQLIQHEKNQGVCAALNTGIKAATGDYVLLCAADDWYELILVAEAKRILQQYPSVGLIGGDAEVHRFDQSTPFRRPLSLTLKNTWISPAAFKSIVRKTYVGFNGGGLLIQRQAALAAGLMYPELRWCCDWLLHFVVAFRLGVYYCDRVFVHIRLRQASYSEGKHRWPDQKKIILSVIRRIAERYPELWEDFKAAALLPGYGFKYLLLALDPLSRRFFTPRLVWRFCINNAWVVRLGRCFPYSVIAWARKWLRA